ncbi:uncharacterized protein EV420DRAFT_1563554 [Desarmillaria tabescens]|uniref:Wax synthase domain-containing protein n=1 Tax=Armillaria tabescens TaxID=1929756 RepID=A0AA39MY40_ARMTA|nr:uncharacterized protein EV420DRAFT_1563554 [Desarmillaria tabescens]KAK0450438.1 hypothetical protein EV420DRAFT_1563554 [Desarmillaria tabescens]
MSWDTWSHYAPPQFNTRARQPVDLPTFLQYILPAFLCYCMSAILTLRSHPFVIRLGFLPATLYAMYRCAVVLDLSNGEETQMHLNQLLLILTTVSSMRATIWTFSEAPCKISDPSKSTLSRLLTSLRGIGWNWGANVYIPPERRPTSSRFVLPVRSRLTRLASVGGGTILDGPLPTLRSTYITLLSVVVMYCAMQSEYDAATPSWHPTEWPPLFDDPWLSTSLSQFWARRWHQALKPVYVSFGGIPLGPGRVGMVLGSFTTSAVIHYLGVWGMGHRAKFWDSGCLFLVSAIGVLAEGAFRRVFGVRVGGLWGWIWTMAWLLFWSNYLVDAWAQVGMIGASPFPKSMRPVDILGWT